MKLSDFLENVGRPVSYYPSIARALGDVKEGVFVCQMFYWKDKGEMPDGWIYKSAEEIRKETGLSYKEQVGVRKGLKKKKLLQEHYARTEHIMYFRVDWDAVNSLWEQYLEEHMTEEHMPKGKMPSPQKADGSAPKVISLNSNTEITHQTTHNVGELSQKDYEQAGEKVMAMYEASKKATYKSREDLPEPMQPLCDVYVELTGQKPTKRVLHDWILAFNDWIGEGLMPSDIRLAYQHATRDGGGFLVGRPGSLTNTAVALKSKNHKQTRITSDPFAGLLDYLQTQEA